LSTTLKDVRGGRWSVDDPLSVRGVTLRGTTAADLRQPIGLLSLYTTGIIGLAVLRVKKTAS